MSLTITEPIKTVNGLLTLALAARSQLLYDIQRKDLPIIAVSWDGNGNVLLKADVDVTGIINVGDSIYYSGDLNGVNGFSAGIYSVTEIRPSPEYFALDAEWLTAEQPVNGYTNDLTSHSNYRILVEVWNSDNTIRLFNKTFAYIPNQEGFLDLDVGAILTSYIKTDAFLSFDYKLNVVEAWTGSTETPTTTTILQAILARKQLLSVGGANMWENLLRNGGGDIALKYPPTIPLETTGQIAWDAPKTVDELRVTVAGNAGNTIQTNTLYQTNGFVAIDTPIVFQMNFFFNVTGFLVAGKLRLDYLGLNESGNWVVITTRTIIDAIANTSDTYINTSNVVALENYTAIGFKIVRLTPSSYSSVVRFTVADGNFADLAAQYPYAKLLTKLKTPLMWTGWNRTGAVLMDSQFLARTGQGSAIIRSNSFDINKVLISGGSSDTDLNDTTKVTVFEIINQERTTQAFVGVDVTDPSKTTILSERLFYKIECEPENPIMLDWINSTGGVDQWLFSGSQNIQIITDVGIVAESPITTDIEFINRTKRRFAKTFRQQITLRAKNLLTDQLLALMEIKETESLRVYLTKDGTQFIDGIIITSFTTDYRTKDLGHDFIVVVELPDGFLFEEGKKY